MLKKIGGVVALVSVCALSLFLLDCGSSSSRPSGTLYVLTQGNNAIGNNVSAFALDLGSGALSLVNSNASTCPTAASQSNPEPCGLPLDILLDPTGATAFVLNQGSPCVPSPPTCTPAGSIAPTIYAYKVNSDGSLGAPSLAATLASGDTAIAMARDAGGDFYFVITELPQLLVFSAKAGSTSLTQVASLSLTKSPSALSAIAFTPPGGSAGELLFVSNNHDDCVVSCNPPHNDNTVSIYAVGTDGSLTEQPNSPYAVAAADPISVQAVNTNPAGGNSGGIFVYVGQGGGVGALYPFQVCWVQNANCSAQDVAGHLMVPLATCPSLSCQIPPSTVGTNPAAMLVDPTNNFLYVLSQGQNQVSGFKITTTSGILSALAPPSLPTGSQPVSMAMHAAVNSAGQSLYSASGQFLYTSNNSTSNITGFTLSTTTGSMSNPFTVAAPAAPTGMAAH